MPAPIAIPALLRLLSMAAPKAARIAKNVGKGAASREVRKKVEDPLAKKMKELLERMEKSEVKHQTQKREFERKMRELDKQWTKANLRVVMDSIRGTLLKTGVGSVGGQGAVPQAGVSTLFELLGQGPGSQSELRQLFGSEALGRRKR